MKSRWIFWSALVTLWFYGYASQAQSNNDFRPTTLLVDGVALAEDKKFEKAREKFESAQAHWQVRISSMLFLKILNDMQNEVIEEKYTDDFFRGVDEAYKAKHKKAEKRFRKVIDKHKDYFPFYLLKAEAQANQKKFEEAAKTFARAIELAGDSPLPYLWRGKTHAKNETSDKAVADLSQAIEIQPSAIARFERGFVWCLEKNYDAAIRDFEVALDSFPQWENSTVVNEAFHNRGVQRLEREDYKAAIRDFDRAIKINPDYVHSYYNRALAYRGLHQYSTAVKDFSRCIQKKPDFTRAYYQRALTHIERRHYLKAAEDLTQALQRHPGNMQYEYKLGESYYKAGKYAKAVEAFNNVIAQDANFYWAYYWKGYAHSYAGQAKSAIAAFQKFISMAPSHHHSQIVYAKTEIEKLKRGR